MSARGLCPRRVQGVQAGRLGLVNVGLLYSLQARQPLQLEPQHASTDACRASSGRAPRVLCGETCGPAGKKGGADEDWMIR